MLGESDDSQNLFQGRVSEMIPGITKFHLGKPLLASMQKNSNEGNYFENTVKNYFLSKTCIGNKCTQENSRIGKINKSHVL